MPVSNGNNAMNVGRDCTLVLVGPHGQIQLDNVMSFRCAQEVAMVKSDRLDGVQLNAALPKGWNGSFEMDRANSGVDDAFARMESDWLQKGVYGVSTIYQYVQNSDGSTSTFQFDNAALTLANAGEWKGDATVKMSINFIANSRKSV